MTLQSDLTAMEKGFWTGGEEFYLDHVDKDCLMAFQDMAGVKSREEIAKMTGQHRWNEVEMRDKGFVTPTPDTAILTYEAHAARDDGHTYDALVSSGYVRRGTEWKLTFHAQSPLDAKH